MKHCYLEHYESRFILKQRIKQFTKWQEVNKLMILIYERKKVVQDSPYPDRSWQGSKARWGKVRRNKATCIIGPLFLFFCFGLNTRSGIILLDPRYINPTCQHAGQLRTDFIHSRAGVHRYRTITKHVPHRICEFVRVAREMLNM